MALTLAFWPRHPAEFEFLKARLAELRFTERSSLARIGIEMSLQGPPVIDGHRLVLAADAFIYDASFPNSPYWKKLLRLGAPVGRLFHAPAAAKLATAEIWSAIEQNELKLPNTISIDRLGRVFLTPHQVSYTLNPKLPRLTFERIVSGDAGRSLLDKVQLRHDSSPLIIPPRSGILTSCSGMYLKEHYVLVLNPGEEAISGCTRARSSSTPGQDLRDEHQCSRSRHNTGDQPVVNPMVSVEVFRAPAFTDPEFKTLAKKRVRPCSTTAAEPLQAHGRRRRPPRHSGEGHIPKTRISRPAARAPRWRTARSSRRPTTT